MKILMSHSKNASLLAPQYFEAFRSMGIIVEGFFHMDYIPKLTIAGRIIHRIYPQLWWNEINDKLLYHASVFKPDIILIFKGMEIYPSTFKTLRDRGIKLVNYNPDHPYEYISRGSGNHNVLNSISLFHTYITYSMNIAADFRKRFPEIPVAVLPFGYSLTASEYYKISIEKEVHRICFIGYADRQRARVIQSLLRHDLEVDVYGPGWSSYFSDKVPGLQIYPAVNGLQYYDQLRRYRVQLNLFRRHNEHSHNMRSFEVPAAGGIMLAPDSKEHRLFFRDRKEVFLYESESDIPQIVRYIMQLSEQQANEIRWKARERSVQSGYDYPSRAVTLLNILRNITH